MFGSSLDQKHSKIKTNSTFIYETTHFSLKGSVLEIEGYASVKDLHAYTENRIRKTLYLVPEIDLAKCREEEEYEELSDAEILELFSMKITLDNCKFNKALNYNKSAIKDYDSLAGFKGEIDLSTCFNGNPLKQGMYKLFIKLEQLSNTDDDVKYEKIIPLSDLKSFFENGMITSKMYYYSATIHKRFNIIVQYDTESKTIRLENTLLQSYNPQELTDSSAVKKESRLIQAIKRRFFKFFYIVFSLLPINKEKISIASDSRAELSGNLYFVYEELYKRNLNLKIKLILNNRIDSKKTFLRLFTTAYHFATSKIILLDDFYPLVYPLNIRRNQDLTQVWHAAGAFKTFGFSRTGRPGGPSPKSRNHRNYTKATVSSEGVREHYAEGFGIEEEKVFATGVPRADIFFDEEYKKYVRETLYQKYPFMKEKKVVLFAPTFRGNGQASAYFPFHVLDFKKLYEELSDEYIFLFKIHPFVNNKLSIPYQYNDFFYDLSDFREINDLLLVTDILITDYSSVCFEFALLNKPMLFFAFDVEEYVRTRDFYYNYFDFIPGPLVKTTDDIVEKIKQKDFNMEKIPPFVKYFFNGTLGKASKNVVDNVIIPSLYEKEEKVIKSSRKITPPSSRFELFDRSIEDEEE